MTTPDLDPDLVPDPSAGVVERFTDALLRRDWATMAGTVTEDVYRCGFEGPAKDSLRGRDAYLAWAATVIDPLFEYRWTIHRLAYVEGRTAAVLEATSHYRVEESDEPFGYEMALTFDIDAASGLISRVLLYWQTPPKKLPVGTVAQADSV